MSFRHMGDEVVRIFTPSPDHIFHHRMDPGRGCFGRPKLGMSEYAGEMAEEECALLILSSDFFLSWKDAEQIHHFVRRAQIVHPRCQYTTPPFLSCFAVSDRINGRREDGTVDAGETTRHTPSGFPPVSTGNSSGCSNIAPA